MTGTRPIETHLAGRNHIANCKAVKMGQRASDTKNFNWRIESLGSPLWRDKVQAELFRYIHSGASFTAAQEELKRVTKTLCKFEKMERLSLLELAVWKTSLQNDPFFESMDDLDAYWALDRDFDPVAYKNERRVTSGIAVIIQGVLPFLE